MFSDLKAGLAAPLKGMGTAFSSSLLGLAGSLVLGFLELQAGHAHNRFYNELEEWLSGITELTPGTNVSARCRSIGSYRAPSCTCSVRWRICRRGSPISRWLVRSAAHGGGDEQLRELARGVNQLVTQMRAEQKVVREWVDEQASQQSEVASALKELAVNMRRKG